MTPTELLAAAESAKFGAEFDLDMLQDDPDSATADDYAFPRAVLALAQHVLATVRADDDEQVTAEWVVTLPGVKQTAKVGNYTLYAKLVDGGHVYVSLAVYEDGSTRCYASNRGSHAQIDNPTRRVVMLVAEAMGMTLGEG